MCTGGGAALATFDPGMTLQQKRSTSIFALPAEDVLFPLVFSRLDVLHIIWQLRRVCKRFKVLCEDYFRVMPRLELSQRHSDAVGPICRILRMCEKLLVFEMRGRRSGLVLPALGPTDHDSILLELGKAPIPLSHLHTLSLDHLELGRPKDSLAGLAVQCGHLKELHISAVSRFDDEMLECLTRTCSCLCQLTLKHTAIRGRPLPGLLARCPGLQHLCVRVPLQSNTSASSVQPLLVASLRPVCCSLS